MRKSQLQKIWKQLDNAYDALERLIENDVDIQGIDVTAIVALKNDVEEMIEKKTRK